MQGENGYSVETVEVTFNNLENRQRRMEVGTTVLRGGLYKCTGESARG